MSSEAARFINNLRNLHEKAGALLTIYEAEAVNEPDPKDEDLPPDVVVDMRTFNDQVEEMCKTLEKGVT